MFDIESANNYVYTLGGTIDFYDEFLAGTFPPGYGGHSVEVTTTVEYTDGCGATQLRSKTYGPVSTTTSLFSISNFKTSIASPNNPATQVAITFESTGTATYQWNLTKGSQTLFNQADFPVDWSTVPGPTIRTSFTSTNSFALYYFRWNEGARRAEDQLDGEGFSPTLRAGYSSNITGSPAAAFTSTLPGLVAFGNTGKWVSRWVSSHEFGHLFQAYLQQAPLGGGAIHSVCTPTYGYVAFDEGFADWHASRWDSQGRSVYFPACTSSDCPPCSTGGYSVEGNVQAFLWDVFDSVNHTNDQGADTIWYPLSRLSDLDGPYNDFDDFYDDWTTRGLWGAYQSVTDALRPLCKVDVP